MSNNTNANATKPTNAALPKLPALRGSATSAPSPCRCGCGTLVPRSYAPGHDATLAAWVKRVLVGQVTVAWVTEQHAGLGAAVARELRARSLPHVKWDAFPAADVKVG